LLSLAVAHGKKRAAAARTRRRATLRRGKGLPGSAGVLVAEGDSWFDYPFYDVLGMLEDDFNFRIESVAHKGDTVESMAYDESQFAAFERKLEHLQRDNRTPRAILLSGGGNDIAGDEFAVLLNHAVSGLPPLNAKVVDGIINERLRFAYVSLLTAMTERARDYFKRVIPIVVHGYAYPVPDGRGYLGGFWALPGPWLEPGFRQKGHLRLVKNADVMEDLIDTFNTMLADVPKQAAGLSHVTCIDLRGVLSNSLAGGVYRRSWENELHPTKAGFAAVAKVFNDVIVKL
jgi:lysophospholipase L1-like esterase